MDINPDGPLSQQISLTSGMRLSSSVAVLNSFSIKAENAALEDTLERLTAIFPALMTTTTMMMTTYLVTAIMMIVVTGAGMVPMEACIVGALTERWRKCTRPGDCAMKGRS